MRDGIGQELHAHHLAAVDHDHHPGQQVGEELEATEAGADPDRKEILLILDLWKVHLVLRDDNGACNDEDIKEDSSIVHRPPRRGSI